MGINLLPLLTGRTFSSVLERGEYDSEARAALTADELAFALIRWVVDIYHNTPHEGLNGATPLQVWNEAAETYGVRLPPSTSQMGPIFARRMFRTLNGEGISVLGVRYHSEDLARFGLHHNERELEVRWYPGDIGAIWVKMGDWVKVGAVFEGYDGVRANDWIAAVRRLRNTLRKGQEASWEIVFKAIREIVHMNNAAKKRANIMTDDWSAESIAHLEENLIQGFVMASKPAAPDIRLSTDGMGHVVTPAAPEPTVAASIATPIVTPRRKGTGKMSLED